MNCNSNPRGSNGRYLWHTGREGVEQCSSSYGSLRLNLSSRRRWRIYRIDSFFKYIIELRIAGFIINSLIADHYYLIWQKTRDFIKYKIHKELYYRARTNQSSSEALSLSLISFAAYYSAYCSLWAYLSRLKSKMVFVARRFGGSLLTLGGLLF